MVDGLLPSEKHTICDVDQLPWQPFEDEVIVENLEERELRTAWRELAEGWLQQ
jgi:hypothetical protein